MKETRCLTQNMLTVNQILYMYIGNIFQREKILLNGLEFLFKEKDFREKKFGTRCYMCIFGGIQFHIFFLFAKLNPFKIIAYTLIGVSPIPVNNLKKFLRLLIFMNFSSLFFLLNYLFTQSRLAVLTT